MSGLHDNIRFVAKNFLSEQTAHHGSAAIASFSSVEGCWSHNSSSGCTAQSLQTAKAIGVEVPSSSMRRADKVIV
jgi:hypothetical protein